MDIGGLIKKLDTIEDKLSDLTVPIEQACMIVETDAKMKCPVDTGQLRNSIRSWMEDKQTGYVGTNVEYAPYVEYGTGIFAVSGTGRKTPWRYKDVKGEWHFTRGQHPQPYLQPAFDANKTRIEEIINDYIQGVINDG